MSKAWSAGIFLFALTVPAMGQETGTLIQHGAAQIDARGPNAARLVMRAFGACVASRSRGRLNKLLLLPVGSAEQVRLSKAIFDVEGDECLSNGELRFSFALLRGSFFEAVYLQQFGRAGPVDFAGVKDSGYLARYTQPYSSEALSAIALEQYGECVARANASAARALTASIPGSSSEAEAFGLLAPSLGPCLTKGNKIQFSKTILRGVISEGLYWLSTAAPSQQRTAK